jgi:Putative lumazine-binding
VDLNANIANIDIAGTIATVRLELDNWTGTNYTDLFTPLKVDGHWKIMNKVFHVHP